MKTKRILLVEDNLREVELTMAALQEINLHEDVSVTRNGVETLDYLQRRNNYSEREPGEPWLVLLDLKMPKLDGKQVLKILKEDEKLKSIPVVILTSSREQRDLEECYKTGANAYVVKPIEFDEFLGTIKCIVDFWLKVNEPAQTPLYEGKALRTLGTGSASFSE